MPKKNLPDNAILYDADIRFRNFAGKPDRFNKEPGRNFSIFIDEKTAAQMERDGWNVNRLKLREDAEEGDIPQALLKVAVRYDNRPPAVTMITSRGRTRLSEDEIELLDAVDIKECDVILNPSRWEVGDKSGIKAYLQTMYITIDENPLELKWGMFDENRVEPN